MFTNVKDEVGRGETQEKKTPAMAFLAGAPVCTLIEMWEMNGGGGDQAAGWKRAFELLCPVA